MRAAACPRSPLSAAHLAPKVEQAEAFPAEAVLPAQGAARTV